MSMIEDLWYKNSIIYSLDLETFLDADGDGVGDFEGLCRRLDYIQSLGVEAIWLNPFQRSPNRDNGYDISDYYSVDERHGSLGDFVQFMHQAKSRGIRVLMDIVVNHTSDQHPWFQRAISDPNSPYRDWYVWSDERPEDWDEGMVFPGVQESTWTYHDTAQSHYFHRFYSFQPDLNIDNPRVREEIRRVFGFWLELGVAGFRMDAVPFVIESVKARAGDGEPHFQYLSELRHFIQWRSGDAILLGEANVAPDQTKQYLHGDGGGGLHMMFNFYVNQYMFYALATGKVEPLRQALEATRDIPQVAQWANFLRNHDELDLGRLSDEDRQEVFERLGPEEHMQLYGRGLRRRLAPMLGDRQRIEMANSLMLSLPGTPVIWAGDEIGMGENLDLPGRQSVRTPMQWSDEAHGGFTLADQAFSPVISDGEYSYQHVNVESQRRDRDSLLNWMTHMIRLRKECTELGWGSWTILELSHPHVLCMRYDWRGNSMVVAHNFSDQPMEIEIEPDTPGSQRLVNLLIEDGSYSENGVHRIAMEPLGYRWYRVGRFTCALHRDRV
jgi:maltose alpha-D-glucosyltransferase/alpha-amylase